MAEVAVAVKIREPVPVVSPKALLLIVPRLMAPPSILKPVKGVVEALR